MQDPDRPRRRAHLIRCVGPGTIQRRQAVLLRQRQAVRSEECAWGADLLALARTRARTRARARQSEDPISDVSQVQKVVNEVYKSFNTHQVPLAILDFQIPRGGSDSFHNLSTSSRCMVPSSAPGARAWHLAWLHAVNESCACGTRPEGFLASGSSLTPTRASAPTRADALTMQTPSTSMSPPTNAPS